MSKKSDKKETVSETIVDSLVLLLTQGARGGQLERYCTTSSLSPDMTDRSILEARRRLTVAAVYNKDEQLGVSITRLENIIMRSANDPRTALQAQKELNKLFGLYRDAGDDEPDGDSAADRQIELVEGYLIPLNLTDKEYPVEEHARLASEIIRRKGLARV